MKILNNEALQNHELRNNTLDEKKKAMVNFSLNEVQGYKYYTHHVVIVIDIFLILLKRRKNKWVQIFFNVTLFYSYKDSDPHVKMVQLAPTSYNGKYN